MKSTLSRIFFILIGSLILFYTFFAYNSIQTLIGEGYYTTATYVADDIKLSEDKDGKVHKRTTAIWNLENRDGELITVKENMLLPNKEVEKGFERKVYYDPNHLLEIIPADSFFLHYGMHLFTLILGIGILIFAWSDNKSIAKIRGNSFAAIMSGIVFVASVIASCISIVLIWIHIVKTNEINSLPILILNVNILSIICGFIVNLVIASLCAQVFRLSEKDQRPNMLMSIFHLTAIFTFIHSLYSLITATFAVFLLHEKLIGVSKELFILPIMIALVMVFSFAFLSKYFYKKADYYVKDSPRPTKKYNL